MSHKVIIAILSVLLVCVGGAWGYTVWQKQQQELADARNAIAAAKQAEEDKRKQEELAAAQAAEVAEPEVEQSPEELEAGPAFEYGYVSPDTPGYLKAFNFAQNNELWKSFPELGAVDGRFMLPRPLKLVTAECGNVNAFYSPDKTVVVLCYEMIHALLERGVALREANQFSEEFPIRYLQANLRFIVMHEVGHALVDLLDLPITGREEDAADQLAGWMMLKNVDTTESFGTLAMNMQMAADFFAADSQQYGMQHYADVHSLGQQRFFNIQCMIYGHDPARFLRIVTSGNLPEDRAQGCPDESERITNAWTALMEPHLAPRYRLTPDQAEQAENKVAEQRRSQAAPYVSRPSSAAEAAADAGTE